MSIAVDRVQNYYQYSDAESKFYQVMIDENCASILSRVELPGCRRLLRLS